MNKKFFKTQYERAYYFYHKMRNYWPLWFYVHNRAARKAWEKQKISLEKKSLDVVRQLNERGIAAIHFADLFGSEALESLNAFVKSRLSHPEVQAELRAANESFTEGAISRNQKEGGKYRKDFLVNLWEGPENPAPFHHHNPFLEFLLSDTVLSIVGSYLNLAPKLKGFSLLSTVVVPPGTPAYLSQRWHRDPEDKKMIKVFLYLTDVDELGAGPFIYIRKSQLGGKWRSLFPQRLPVGRYPEEGAVERLVPKEDIQVNFARAGTVIFCDTSGLHKGGFSTTKPRVMFTGGFTSQASIHPPGYVQPDQSVLAGYGNLARFAVKP